MVPQQACFGFVERLGSVCIGVLHKRIQSNVVVCPLIEKSLHIKHMLIKEILI